MKSNFRKLSLFLTLILLLGVTFNTAIASSPYRLPWVYCFYKQVTQGWDGSVSHTGNMQYAYDFNHSEGEAVRASLGGQISHIKSDVPADNCCSDSSCANNANYVVIDHYDGKSTLYLHLHSVYVGEGNYVNRGETIGTAGKTGWTSCAPHLHFQRQDQGSWFTQSRPVYFDEYPGIELQEDHWYRSGNSWPGDYCPTLDRMLSTDSDNIHSSSTNTVDISDATTWFNYTNPFYDLRFRYPPSIELIPQVWTSSSNNFQEDLHISFLDDSGKDIMSVSVHENQWIAPEEFFAEMERTARGDVEQIRYPFVQILGKTEIKGQPALVFDWDNMVTGQIRSVAVMGHEWMYIFHTWSGETQALKGRIDLMDRILKTLEISSSLE